MQDKPTPAKPKTQNLGVSLYPNHLAMLDDLAEYYGITRSRAVQFLVEKDHARVKELMPDA